MPLESVTYTHDLVVTNPDHNDNVGVADSHIRNIKAALRNTFPNFAGAPMTLSEAQLNALSTAVTRLAALEAASNHLTGDQLLPGNLTTAVGKYINAGDVRQNGFSLVPSGVITLWYGPIGTVPSGWALCNGANGTPDLRDRFVVGAGTTYSPGSTGGNDVVTATSAVSGAHSHNGVTEMAGAHGHTTTCDVQGAHDHAGGTLGHALTIEEIPPHSHTLSQHAGPAVSGSASGDWSTGSGVVGVATGYTGSGFSHNHVIGLDGWHAHAIGVGVAPDHNHTIDWEAGHSHSVSMDVRPKYYALQYIMKV